MKPRGIVAEEEDPKPSHQLCKLQIKSTLSAKQTLCLWKIKIKVSLENKNKKCLWPLRTPTEENSLALIAVDIGGKNTQD